VIAYIRVCDLWIYTGIIIAGPDLWRHSIGILANMDYLIFIPIAKTSGGKSMLITKSDNSMVSNPTDDVILRYIGSVSRIHVVRCAVPDYKPVYWLVVVVKPPLDPQHGGINKQSRVCDVRCKTLIG